MLFPPKTLLTGDKIYLEKPIPSFHLSEELFQLLETNQSYLTPWFGLTGKHLTLTAEEMFKLLLNINIAWQEQRSFTYLIYTHDKEFIGMMSAYVCEPQNAGLSLKFWIAKKHIRHGYALQAIQLIEKEFFFLGMERLVISSDANNLKTRNLALKAGFKYEGTAEHGYWNPLSKSYCDLIICSKVKGGV